MHDLIQTNMTMDQAGKFRKPGDEAAGKVRRRRHLPVINSAVKIFAGAGPLPERVRSVQIRIDLAFLIPAPAAACSAASCR